MSSTYQPGESRWSGFIRNAFANAGGINGMGAVNPVAPLVDWLNATPNPVKPVVADPAKDPLNFGAGVSTKAPGMVKAPVASGPKPASGSIPDVTGFLSGALGGPVEITSGYRTPAHNLAVGGVKNSAHTEMDAAGNPLAYDFKPPKGMDSSTAAKLLSQNLQGQYDQIIAEGDHVHVSFDPRGRGQTLEGDERTGYKPLGIGGGMLNVRPTVAAGDSTNFPGVVTMDPAAVGSMIPGPHLLSTNVKLPPAPQMDMPEPLSPLQGIDKAQEMEALKTAYAVKPRDSSHDAWDRMAALLQGAAAGGARADTIHGGVGNLLLNAGAGAAAGFRDEKKLQKGEQEKYDEMVRQANIALAQQGFNIDLKNIDVSNQNIERGDTSKERTRQTKFTNATELFQAKMNALNINLGRENQNAGALNARDMQRTQAVVGAMEGNAEAQNRANAGQVQENLAGGGTGAVQRQIGKLLTDSGIDVTDEKNPRMAPTRQVAMGVISGQVDTALNGFAQDLVANGGAQEILAPDKGDKPEFAKMKAQALRALKGAKKPGDPGALQATQLLAQILNADHATALKIIHDFAGRGYPTAKLIMNHNQGGAQ